MAFFHLRSDGSARPVAPEQKTPFAVLTFFQPEKQLDLPHDIAKRDLLAFLENVTDANLFTALRIDDVFDGVCMRSVRHQHRPFPSLTEATAHQSENVFRDVEGTLAGSRTPSYAQGIGVAGFHLHFLRQDKKGGGMLWITDFAPGRVQIDTLHDFHVELPNSADFLKVKFDDKSVDQQMEASEG